MLRKNVTCDKEDLHKAYEDKSYKVWDKFGYDEVIQITHVPLVISDLAWYYAEKFMRYCADNRISKMSRFSRRIKEIEKEYYDELRMDIQQFVIDSIRRDTENYVNEMNTEFTILKLSTKNELLKMIPDDPLIDVKVDATIALMMTQFYHDHNMRMNELIESKMGAGCSIDNRFIGMLKDELLRILDGSVIKNSIHLDNWIKSFQTLVKNIQSELVDEEDFEKEKKQHIIK